jgi:hypothetical protein
MFDGAFSKQMPKLGFAEEGPDCPYKFNRDRSTDFPIELRPSDGSKVAEGLPTPFDDHEALRSQN